MPSTRSSFTNFRKILLIIVVLLTFFILYFPEFKLIWELVIAYFFVLVLHINIAIPINLETLRSIAIIAVNFIIFVVGYLSTLFWIAQFALPVRSRIERRKAFKSLFRYTWNKSHGPAVFVKEGHPRSDKDELNNLHPGVAFVDLNSAIVLEQQLGSNDAVRQEVRFEPQSDNTPERTLNKKPFSKNSFNPFRKLRDKANITIVKAFGPGVVFTESGEKIIGWADLRKQARTLTGVQACTRDGIEITTNVTAVFTLGQAEEILQVTKTRNGWVVVQTSPVSENDLINNPNLKPTDLVVSRLLDDQLREEDIEELNLIYREIESNGLEEGLKQLGQRNNTMGQFIFDEERVFAAVYSRARHAKDGILGEWTDLPVYVAAEIFRGLLAHETYDDLYLPDDPQEFPLAGFKGKFARVVQNMGILGYQIVMNKDLSFITIGQVWDRDGLISSNPRKFQSSAVLRDRGIKVLAAGFSDLVPINEVVRAQLFENWRAHWQKETQKTLADHELRAARVHNHERARTQQDMIYSLSRIFRDGNYTDEALAIRLYQALEIAATHPATQRLLPADTVQMLSNLRQWLLPNSKYETDSEDGVTSLENPK